MEHQRERGWVLYATRIYNVTFSELMLRLEMIETTKFKKLNKAGERLFLSLRDLKGTNDREQQIANVSD